MLATILGLITAFFQFPTQILAFVKLLQKTPEEKHDELLKKIAEEAAKFEESGRPQW